MTQVLFDTASRAIIAWGAFPDGPSMAGCEVADLPDQDEQVFSQAGPKILTADLGVLVLPPPLEVGGP